MPFGIIADQIHADTTQQEDFTNSDFVVYSPAIPCRIIEEVCVWSLL